MIYPYFCLHETKVKKNIIRTGNNAVTGSISAQIENMKNVKVIFLGKQLMISIFKYFLSFLSFANVFLVDLEIDNNQLDGSIPTEIGTLNSLEKLNLGEFITECGDCKNIMRN